MGLAILIDGPLGAGKTTLGLLLAERLKAGFVDGDDHHVHGRSWYGSSLTTSRAILEAGLASIRGHGIVVIAYPLRCLNWVYYERKFARADVGTVFVGLAVSAEEITGRRPGRSLSAAEMARSVEMVAQGYGRRHFHQLVIPTGGPPVTASLRELEAGTRRLSGLSC